jgi:L-aspartate semialdehyde sulfurtransferase ferredoxin
MPVVNVELNGRLDTVQQPIIWRLSKLYNVVTNVRRARVTEDYGYVLLEMEGSSTEIEQASAYLAELGLIKGASDTSAAAARPEDSIPQPNTIYVRLTTISAEQGQTPVLYRIGKDLGVVVNLRRADFDEEEGGSLEVNISGKLFDVQRSIAYLHTTGIHVNPRQRSVTDYSNL